MQKSTPALLPSGLQDLLAPYAAHERKVSGRLLKYFERFDYAQVSPPLIEFEDSLLSGRGSALATQTFRVMDPLSQEMMGVRPDITMQVARIASSRLQNEPRPLRLAYNGSTIRAKAEKRGGARQIRQAGLELIGVADAKADAEVLAVAAAGLAGLGINDLVIDISLPGLVGEVLRHSNISAGAHADITAAVECKDTCAVKDVGVAGLAEMIEAAGPAEAALQQLQSLDIPETGKQQVAHVAAVLKHLQTLGVQAEFTIDPVENRGFEYYTLVSFALFSRSAQYELGRGGRYTISHENGEEEPATGVSLYVNTLMDIVSVAEETPVKQLPENSTLADAEKWQKEGYRTQFQLLDKGNKT